MAAGIFVPIKTQAADLSASQIVVTTDTLVNGQPSNFIRMGKDGSATIQVQITLTNPSQLQVGTDTVNFPSGIGFIDTSQNRTIQGFGATVTAQNTSGGGSCFTDTKSGAFFAGNAQYAKCDGPLNDFQNFQKTVQQGQVIYTHTFTINASNLSGLGVSQVKSGSSSGLNKILVYPGMNFNSTSGSSNFFVSFLNAGKTVYVQLYDTQANANADTSPTPSCSASNTTDCVPGYGSTTGGGAQVDQTGSSLIGFINKLIVALLGLVNEIVYFIFYWLIAPLVQAMLSIHTYQDQFVNVIYPGWEIVRNACNIFFIIAIIAMALATLFRVEGYQFRHILVSMVIAALLVNFSLVIGQVILAFADTLQSQFLPNNINVIRSLARDLMVTNTRDAVFNVSLTGLGSFSYTVTFFFWVALAVGSFCVFAAIAIFLVIRVIALWILLMLSPVAYVAGVLPATHSARQEWWNQFLKYAFFTPVMAFFLNMAAVISDSSRAHSVLQQVTAASNFADSNAPAISTFVFQVASNLMLLVFLIVAIKVADSFGIYGASAITDIAQKGVMRSFQPWTWPGAKTIGDYKTRKSLELTQPDAHGNVSLGKKVLFAAMNPKTTFKGYQHQSEEKRKTTQAIAEGRGFDIARQVAGGQPSEEGLESQDHLIADYKKHNPYRTTDQIVAHFGEINSARANKLQKEIAYEATIEQAAENKDLNDLLNDQGFSADRQGYLMFLDEMVKSGKLSEGRAARLAEKLSSTAFANNEYWYGWGSKDGHLIDVKKHKDGLVLDPVTNKPKQDKHGHTIEKWVWDDVGDDKQSKDLYEGMLNEQTAKFKKKEPQDLARNLHHSAVRAVNPDGTARGITELGADMIMNADDRLYDQANRANAEQVKAFKSVVGNSGTITAVADAYIRDAKKQNIQLSQSDAEKMAIEKIQKFSEKYLRFDSATGVDIPKDKGDPAEALFKKGKLKIEFRQIHKDSRDDVQSDFSQMLSSPAEYKFTIPESLTKGLEANTKLSDAQRTNIQNEIQKTVLDTITQRIAGDLSPKNMVANNILKPLNIEISSTTLAQDQERIAQSLEGVITANPNVQLKDMENQLKDAIVNSLNNASTPEFKALTDDQKREVAAQILVSARKK